MNGPKKCMLWALVVRAFAPSIIQNLRFGHKHPWRVPGRIVFFGENEYAVRQIGPENAPNIVLVHGLAGSSLSEWYKVGPALAEVYRVTMVDQRGHGVTPPGVGRSGIDRYASDLAGVLGAVGVDSAAFVGYSMGGVVTQALARSRPDLVTKMVLIATFATHPRTEASLRWLFVRLTRGVERLTGIGSSDVRALYLLATGATEVRYATWAWEEAHRRDIESVTRAAGALFGFDSTSWIGQLDQSALVIIPEKDQLVNPQWQHRLAGLLKQVEVIKVRDGKHELPWTHSALLASEIRRFVG